ncbi:C-C motif chemokine 19-like [Hypanus sabinus]|uniref:C-C motif chemokine 19-like n=1 Tax=Hypanus sabinus TaxID=79690 RepID=UPI0028C48D1D|nr:C-C motif chemokine 19-like [Hypanus sabinus]
MKTVPAALFLLSAIAALWSISQASDNIKSLSDCCLSTSPKRIPAQLVISYKIQKAGDGCNVDAVAFKTKKQIVLCSPPEESWVIRLKRIVKRKMKKSRNQKKQN